MANSIANVALGIAASIELSIIAKATVVLALALLGTQLVRRAKASVRHALLASTFGVLLSLPLAAILMPPLAIEIPMSQRDVSETTAPARSGTELESAEAVSNMTPLSDVRVRRSVSALMLFRTAWAIGVALVLLYLSTALWRVRSTRRESIPWVDGQSLLRQLAEEAGIRRPVDVLLHEQIVAPMTCGLFRPAIVLPADAEAWSGADLQHALIHELEHVRRADWPVQLFARIVCGVYWFHPLAWTAWRRLSLEAERACDDAVLRCADRTAYAEQLLLLARRLLRADSRTVLSMANRSDLSARVEAVLDVDQARGRAGFVRVALFGAAAVLLVLFVSPLAAIQQATAPAPRTQAQTTAVDNLSFEVASIKPNKSDSPRYGYVGFLPGGRFEAKGATLQELISLAYERGNGQQLRPSEIIGGPRWIAVDRFDIEAKAETNHPGPTERSPQEIIAMLRALLTDRFGLAAHYETRELPIYTLVLLTKGKLGPNLRRSPVDCSGLNGGTTPPPTVNGKPYPCRSDGGPGRMTGRGMPIATLTSGRLPRLVDRLVVDRTGLTGAFEWDLEWTPLPAELAPQRERQVEPPSDGPWIVTALQEQLGLKLESGRGPVDVLVIESVQQPSDDAALANGPSPRLAAQSSTRNVGNPAFEVASIKPNKSGDNRVVMQGAPDRITATNVTVRLLIRTAYRVQDSQISGGPSWLDSDRFDIVAKAAGKPSQEQLQIMLRMLLVDRFKLTTHIDSTERDIYALVVDRSDGRLGPQLTRRDCVTLPPSPLTPSAKDPLQCNIIQTGSGRVNFRGALMSQIAEGLSVYVNRVVLDRTGLGGNYDVDLQWMPELFPPADGQPRPSDGAIGPDASSIFTAVREQLGLKLESTRGPVDVLVIDSVEQPTPD